MAPLERAMVVSYKFSIVTVALSVITRPQLAIECPLGADPYVHVGVAKSEHPRLTNGEIIFEEFRPI